MDRLLNWMAARKDGITTLLTVVFLFVGFFQYLEYRSDRRIEIALDILERREGKHFIDARTYLLNKWFNAEGELQEEFRKTDTYTPALYQKITQEIHQDNEYKEALLSISAFYSNAAACVLDGLCDEPTVCASLMGEVQDYLDLNRNYFVYVRDLRDEDAMSLYLHHAEFVSSCDRSLYLNLYSRTDRSTSCYFARALRRIGGIRMEGFCQGAETEYGQKIVDLTNREL